MGKVINIGKQLNIFDIIKQVEDENFVFPDDLDKLQEKLKENGSES